MPGLDAWCFASHRRHCSRVRTSSVMRSAAMVRAPGTMVVVGEADRVEENLGATVQLGAHCCLEGRHVRPHDTVGRIAVIHNRVV